MKMSIIGTVLSAAVFATFTMGQTTPENVPEKTDQPQPDIIAANASETQETKHTFTSLRGLELGMTISQVKEKLGKPDFQDETGLVFELKDGDSVQIGLGPDKNVRTIAAIFSADSETAPSFADVFGPDAGSVDGDVYKMERYPDAGYWVSFSRTNSKDEPVTVVTLRKIF